jgi:putative peptide zinc metalloprotease protein
VVWAVGFVPVPLRSRAEGVVWIPDEALVRVETDGFIERIVARPGGAVRRGDVLVVCVDPVLTARAEVLRGRQRELQARYDEQRPVDQVRAGIIRDEIGYVSDEIARVRERLAGLTIRSEADGVFVMPLSDNFTGRFVRQGELLGHVVDLSAITVRTVVPQSEIELVQSRTRAVEVRLAERLAETRPATLKRQVPGASERLPSAALGSEGGGTVASDPRDPQGLSAVQRVFQVDLELPPVSGLVNIGGRVYVRFDHGREPLAMQWYRELRQIFLARFNV